MADNVADGTDGVTIDKYEFTSDDDSTSEVYVMPLRHPGQIYDEDALVHYNWNRWYRPEDGRYLSPDPIGLAGGEPGYFSYVNSNPLASSDPTGLHCDACDGSFEEPNTLVGAICGGKNGGNFQTNYACCVCAKANCSEFSMIDCSAVPGHPEFDVDPYEPPAEGFTPLRRLIDPYIGPRGDVDFNGGNVIPLPGVGRRDPNIYFCPAAAELLYDVCLACCSLHYPGARSCTLGCEQAALLCAVPEPFVVPRCWGGVP